MTDWDDETTTKYIVTKADGTPVDDGVVIRLKDPFAATALYTYSHTIMSLVELMGEDIDTDTLQRMIDIADYFGAKADESVKITGKRLPD